MHWAESESLDDTEGGRVGGGHEKQVDCECLACSTHRLLFEIAPSQC